MRSCKTGFVFRLIWNDHCVYIHIDHRIDQEILLHFVRLIKNFCRLYSGFEPHFIARSFFIKRFSFILFIIPSEHPTFFCKVRSVCATWHKFWAYSLHLQLRQRWRHPNVHWIFEVSHCNQREPSLPHEEIVNIFILILILIEQWLILKIILCDLFIAHENGNAFFTTNLI